MKLRLQLLAISTVLLAASQALVPGTPEALAQEGDEQAGPTPVVSTIQPGIVTVVPQQTVVVPIEDTAEARTGEAGQGLAGEESNGNMFTGVRGGLIGAGIGFVAVLALAVAVAAIRRGFNRERQ